MIQIREHIVECEKKGKDLGGLVFVHNYVQVHILDEEDDQLADFLVGASGVEDVSQDEADEVLPSGEVLNFREAVEEQLLDVFAGLGWV